MTDQAFQETVVCNARGLHARAAAKFVKMAETYNAKIIVEKDGQLAPGCSIMELLMLGASQGSKIIIRASGPQAAEAVESLADLVCKRFGEDS